MASFDPMFVLSTINARYQHASFGLRYLAANMGELAPRTRVIEFTNRNSIDEMVSALCDAGSDAAPPSVVGLGVYIWNVHQSAELVAALKQAAPQIRVVLGGPEVSHELEAQAWTAAADYVIQGEADLAFAQLCRRLDAGQRPLQRVVQASPPPLEQLAAPYPLYSDQDLAHRMLYVEASRGCPYRCEFCLSSLDKKVRAFELEPLLAHFDDLLARGARHFKFVDRTFNLDLKRSAAILEFFLARVRPGLFLHFEMVPDRLPDELRSLIQAFPEGAMQFEVGIQSFDPEVGKRIQRKQNLERTLANLHFLVEDTGVHVHADLIAGLPGEGLESFGEGFDRLHATGVHEIQVGILKRLRGTPIARHAEAFDMHFSETAPYTIESTRDLDAPTLVRVNRFAQAWDVFANQGRFSQTVKLLWAHAPPFRAFMEFCDWHFEQSGQIHGVDLFERARLLAEFLSSRRDHDRDAVLKSLREDMAGQGHKFPAWLRSATDDGGAPASPLKDAASIPARQARHLAARRRKRG